jgi:formate transporter
VANMYFIPSALLIKELDPAYFATVAEKLKDGGAILTWGNFIVRNLIPATIGNIIGGALMVGGMYWFIYLRPSWTRHPGLEAVAAPGTNPKKPG